MSALLLAELLELNDWIAQLETVTVYLFQSATMRATLAKMRARAEWLERELAEIERTAPVCEVERTLEPEEDEAPVDGSWFLLDIYEQAA